jgi:hypothetical protein
MARDNSEINAVLISDLTDLKGKVQILNDVLNVMDWAVDSSLELLEQGGQISPEEGLLNEYRRAIKVLRQRGFSAPRATNKAGVACPGCKAVLKDVAGKPGDRCSWCGYEFH